MLRKARKEIGNPRVPGRLDESEWDKFEFGTSSDSILNRKLLNILEEAGVDKSNASELLMTKKEQQEKIFQEKLAAGTLLPHEIPHTNANHDSPAKKYLDNLIGRGAKKYDFSKDDVENKVPVLDKHGTLEQSDIMERPEGALYGTSFECGPTNCGSLTLDDPSLQSHGAFQSIVGSVRDGAIKSASQELDARESSERIHLFSPVRYPSACKSKSDSGEVKSKVREL